MQITETEIHPNYTPKDIALTEAGVDAQIENRKAAMGEALEVHKAAVADKERADAAAALLETAKRALSAKSG